MSVSGSPAQIVRSALTGGNEGPANAHGVDLSWQVDLYKDLHRYPELSGAERETAARVAAELHRFPSWEVTTGIGGYGITAVLRNGEGPTVLFRADLDGLPVMEATGVPYASGHDQLNAEGQQVPTMHACGHDAHTVSALGALAILDAARDSWSGTAIILFQPAEELGIGAHGMVNDGLADRIPRPDVCLDQHVLPGPSGTVYCSPGPMTTSSTTIEITLFGRGAHASMPHRSVDPVVLTAAVVMKLQTVVSRELPPGEFGVVTVASMEAGKANNVIPDSAKIALSCRFYNERWRLKAMESIKRIVRAEAMAAGCEREPEFRFVGLLTATNNDAGVFEVVRPHFDAHFGTDSKDMDPWTASEDFPVIPTAFGCPYLFWTVGITPRRQWARAEAAGRLDIDIPSNHNPGFLPDLASLPVTTEAAAVAVLACLDHDWHPTGAADATDGDADWAGELPIARMPQ